jgi:excinuclease ABC subunit C
MYETIYRRLSPKNIASWGLPDIMLIDGGKGQLDTALKAAEERQVKPVIISIAKREEELIVHRERSGIDTAEIERFRTAQAEGIFVERSGDYYIVNLHPDQRNASPHSKNLQGGTMSVYTDVTKLFQRIRDESHRFAVSYHTVLKRQKQTASGLEDVPGIGPATRRKLIKSFGSLRGVQSASKQELDKVIGKSRADSLVQFLGRDA